MGLPRVIPALLLRDDGLYKGSRFKDERYVGDPINIVKIFNEKEVDEIALLDIDASVHGTAPNFDYIAEFAGECFMPLCYGGGVASLEHMERLFRLGVEKVSLNAAAVSDPELVREAAKEFGSQSVIVGMDVHRGILGGAEVRTHRATRRSGTDAVSHARAMADLGAGELIVTSVSREGSMKGYDLSLIREVSEAVSVPVVANGGAGRLEDFEQALSHGASAVMAGAMFVFQGRHRAVLVTYPAYEDIQRMFEG